jgi:hypothetical protein
MRFYRVFVKFGGISLFNRYCPLRAMAEPWTKEDEQKLVTRLDEIRPDHCSMCGECELQEAAYRLGIEKPSERHELPPSSRI